MSGDELKSFIAEDQPRRPRCSRPRAGWSSDASRWRSRARRGAGALIRPAPGAFLSRPRGTSMTMQTPRAGGGVHALRRRDRDARSTPARSVAMCRRRAGVRHRLGRWAARRPGTFPFYVGLIVVPRASPTCSWRSSTAPTVPPRSSTRPGAARDRLLRHSAGGCSSSASVPLGLYVAPIALPDSRVMLVQGRYSGAAIALAVGLAPPSFFLVLRGLVQGAAAQGAARGAARHPLNGSAAAWTTSASCCTASRSSVTTYHVCADGGGRAARHPGRRAAGARRAQRRVAAAAADLCDGPGGGDHPAHQHVLGRAVRRVDDVDPVQHSRASPRRWRRRSTATRWRATGARPARSHSPSCRPASARCSAWS